MPVTVAIDFGGVLSIHSRGEEEETGHRSVTINMPGVMDALDQLRQADFTLILNSFCGRSRAQETYNSLVASGVNYVTPPKLTLYHDRMPIGISAARLHLVQVAARVLVARSVVVYMLLLFLQLQDQPCISVNLSLFETNARKEK